MAKIGDLCNKCGRVIKSYPIYGDGTCHVCRYEKFINEDISKLKTKIDEFYKERLEKDPDVSGIDYILTNFVEVLPLMKDNDIQAIQYILDNIKNR